MVKFVLHPWAEPALLRGRAAERTVGRRPEARTRTRRHRQTGSDRVWVSWRSWVSPTAQPPAVSPAPPRTAAGSELGFEPPQPPDCCSCPAWRCAGQCTGWEAAGRAVPPPSACQPGADIALVPSSLSCHHHPHAISLSSRGWAPPCDSQARFCPHPGLLPSAAGIGHAQGVWHVQPQRVPLPVPSSCLSGHTPSLRAADKG